MSDLVDFATLANLLTLRHGWQTIGDRVVAPSGGLWIFESELHVRTTWEIYARAVNTEGFLRVPNPEGADEFLQLRDVLADDADVHLMLEHHRGASNVFHEWAPVHGMHLDDWPGGSAGIEATARHPRGGIASIVWRYTGNEAAVIHVFRRVDDWDSCVRWSWRSSQELERGNSEALMRILDASVDKLLDESYELTSSPLARSKYGESVHPEYRPQLDTLR